MNTQSEQRVKQAESGAQSHNLLGALTAQLSEQDRLITEIEHLCRTVNGLPEELKEKGIEKPPAPEPFEFTSRLEGKVAWSETLTRRLDEIKDALSRFV